MAGALPSPALCLITDETRSPRANEYTVRAALSSGCRWVQLRHRRISALEFYRLALRLRELTDEHGAILIVNDRVDVALAANADGVHLPGAGLTADAARELIGTDKLIGQSVHSLDEIIALEQSAVDYFQFGPVFDTASKRAYGAPQGLQALRAACKAAKPRAVCAVGGITSDNAQQAIDADAAGIAVIGAIHEADDLPSVTTDLIAVQQRRSSTTPTD